MGKDLGTYHLRIEFADGRGYIQKWETCARYFSETDGFFPLKADSIPAHWNDESEILSSMSYMYLDGNYSCDCNRASFMDRANRCEKEDPEDENAPDPYLCGETLQLQRLTAIRPDHTEVVLFYNGAVQPTDQHDG